MTSPRLTEDLSDLLAELDYAGHAGLVTKQDTDTVGPRGYMWRDLHERVGLDAVFFQDGVPIVGFATERSGAGLANLQRRLWNYGKIPILLNVANDGVKAFNAVTNPGSQGNETPEILAERRRHSTARGLLTAFNRLQVTAGGFAETHGSSYKYASRVDQALLSNLDYLRRSTAGNDPRHQSSLDVVVGGALVASYLADRGVLTEGHFASLAQAANLQGVLDGGRKSSIRLFTGLAEHFNGDVFGPVPEALQYVTDEDLWGIASLLRGDNLPTGQQSLWPYDFSVLPTDLVGSIYEQLLQENRRNESTYYTPRFLVSLLLDEVMDWDAPRNTTLIDLACGSGAFMTEAFRRMAYQARNRAGRQLEYGELTALLQARIFGVEKNRDAARVAAFGLYLALLEELEPRTVWDTVVLPKLIDHNIIVADAFEEHGLSGKLFDAVVSNPPWQSQLTAASRNFVRSRSLPIADQQIANSFLWLGKEMLLPGGKLGLVMPARALLHNRSAPAQKFRSAVFTELNVRAILDLSALRHDLFSSAVAPTALLIAETRSGDTDPVARQPDILHIAPHARSIGSALNVLIVTPEEVRTVSARQAATRSDIWKILLWGSPRDLQLVDRLRGSFPSVGEVAAKLNWTTGRGYQVRGGGESDASALLGLTDVPTSAVNRLTIDMSMVSRFDLAHLHRTRSAALFRGPHVLVRRGLSAHSISAALVDEDAVFGDGVIGVAGPRQDRALLATFAAAVVSSLGQYYHIMTSSSWGVERPLVEKSEHMSLPLATPSDSAYERLSRLLRAAPIDFVAEFFRELDDVVFDIYQLSQSERNRIQQGLQLAKERYYEPRLSTSPVTDQLLEKYQETMCATLQTALPVLDITGRRYRIGSYGAVAINLGRSSTQPSVREVDIESILRASNRDVAASTGIVSQPAGFFVDEDTVYVIKTLDRDRWSTNAALDDADRIVGSLMLGR